MGPRWLGAEVTRGQNVLEFILSGAEVTRGRDVLGAEMVWGRNAL